MKLKYRISLWNYRHYINQCSLEQVVGEIAREGYGVELWPTWEGTGKCENLFEETNRDRLRKLLKGVPSSWHAGGPDIFHQIDTASYVGSDVIVGHAPTFRLEGEKPDFDFARKVLDYAKRKNVTMVIENCHDGGFLPNLKKDIEELVDLKICLDTGHIYVYNEPNASLKAYIDGLKNRLHHLHLNDFINHCVRDYGDDSYPEHFIPGTGIMPREDWVYLLRALEEVNFRGAAVLEIRPRVPVETARETVEFFNTLRVCPGQA